MTGPGDPFTTVSAPRPRRGVSRLLLRTLPGAVLLALTGCDPVKPVPPPPSPTPSPTPTPKPTATPKPTPKPSPTPTPVPTIDRKRMEVSRLFNDMEVVSTVDAVRSHETASMDRTQRGSYRLELTVRADVPVASQTAEQITKNDPTLLATLPGLERLLPTAKVSASFEQIYALKLDYLKSRLARIDTLLDRHNFYDVETMLELQNPATGQRALFLQGDMDVNTDGSDGDRNFDIDGSSMFFQPQTSYRWKRLTTRPNQFLTTTKGLIAKYKAELATNVTAARRAELKDTLAHEQATLYEIERYSFLIAGADPYIVLPGFMLRNATGPFAPAIGDYAAVIHNGVVYPAILGDAGPSHKFGEASSRLCKQLNPRSSAISRPVSNLKVTYIVFPGSKDVTAGPPDLAKWRDRCTELFAGLGLKPAEVYDWPDLIKPWPTPTPTPTPNPTPAPLPSGSDPILSPSPVPGIPPAGVTPPPGTVLPDPAVSPSPSATPAPTISPAPAPSVTPAPAPPPAA